MFAYPRMVWRNMVGHKIENQPHAALGEFPSRHGETLGASKTLVDDIAPHAIGRSHVVSRNKIGQRLTETLLQIPVLIGDGNACGTAFPDAHQPHTIKA